MELQKDLRGSIQSLLILHSTQSPFLHFLFESKCLQSFSEEQSIQVNVEVLQTGKEDVNITAIEPVGNYAVKLTFTDGHDTGLYSWDYLYYLGENYEALWLEYIGKLDAAGHKRK